jgi:hypothetical protein
MKRVDMSAKAVTARLKRVSQLRRLCLSLQKAKLPAEKSDAKTTERTQSSRLGMRKTK